MGAAREIHMNRGALIADYHEKLAGLEAEYNRSRHEVSKAVRDGMDALREDQRIKSAEIEDEFNGIVRIARQAANDKQAALQRLVADAQSAMLEKREADTMDLHEKYIESTKRIRAEMDAAIRGFDEKLAAAKAEG